MVSLSGILNKFFGSYNSPASGSPALYLVTGIHVTRHVISGGTYHVVHHHVRPTLIAVFPRCVDRPEDGQRPSTTCTSTSSTSTTSLTLLAAIRLRLSEPRSAASALLILSCPNHFSLRRRQRLVRRCPIRMRTLS